MLSNSVATSAEARVRFAGVASTELDEVSDLVEVGPTMGLVRKLADSGYEFSGEVGVELFCGIFLLGYVIPHEEEGSSSKWVEDAKALWDSWISEGADRGEEMRHIASSLVKEKLKSIVIDEKAAARWVLSYSTVHFIMNLNLSSRPEYIIQCITPSPPGVHIDPLRDILPSHEELDALLESSSLPSSTVSPSLALLDPTLPTFSGAPIPPNSTCRKYARAVSALLAYLTASRTVARSNLWALRHILVLAFYAKEYLRVGDTGDSLATFDIARDRLEDVVEKVKSMATYLLGRVEDGTHAKVVNALMREGSAVPQEEGNVVSFVIAVARRAQEKDRVRDTAVLGIVLQHLFGDATKDDADLWLSLARRLQKTGQFVPPSALEGHHC